MARRRTREQGRTRPREQGRTRRPSPCQSPKAAPTLQLDSASGRTATHPRGDESVQCVRGLGGRVRFKIRNRFLVPRPTWSPRRREWPWQGRRRLSSTARRRRAPHAHTVGRRAKSGRRTTLRCWAARGDSWARETVCGECVIVYVHVWVCGWVCGCARRQARTHASAPVRARPPP